MGTLVDTGGGQRPDGAHLARRFAQGDPPGFMPAEARDLATLLTAPENSGGWRRIRAGPFVEWVRMVAVEGCRDQGVQG